MWQSMRVLRRFTAADLQATAEVSRASATRYLKALHDAHYITPLSGQHHGRAQFTQYRLVRNSGPLAPRVSRDGKAHDMNADAAARVPTVTIPRSEYDRALRCITLVQSIRANGAGPTVRQCAAEALEIAR